MAWFWRRLDDVVVGRLGQAEARRSADLDARDLAEGVILVDIIRGQRRILERLDHLMARTDELSDGLAQLGSSVDELAGRIASLPTSVDEITQEQLDALHEITGRVVSLAQAAPEVPTEPVADDTGL